MGVYDSQSAEVTKGKKEASGHPDRPDCTDSTISVI